MSREGDVHARLQLRHRVGFDKCRFGGSVENAAFTVAVAVVFDAGVHERQPLAELVGQLGLVDRGAQCHLSQRVAFAFRFDGGVVVANCRGTQDDRVGIVARKDVAGGAVAGGAGLATSDLS